MIFLTGPGFCKNRISVLLLQVIREKFDYKLNNKNDLRPAGQPKRARCRVAANPILNTWRRENAQNY